MEERLRDIEGRNLEMTQVEKQSFEGKNNRTLWELSDSIKKSNVRIMGITEGEERKQKKKKESAYTNK